MYKYRATNQTPISLTSEVTSNKSNKTFKSASKYEKQRPGLERLYMETHENARVIDYIEHDYKDYQALDYYLWDQESSAFKISQSNNSDHKLDIENLLHKHNLDSNILNSEK